MRVAKLVINYLQDSITFSYVSIFKSSALLAPSALSGRGQEGQLPLQPHKGGHPSLQDLGKVVLISSLFSCGKDQRSTRSEN